MRPLIIPIFLPNLGCREHCLFCNQKAVAKEISAPLSVQKFIENSLRSLPPNNKTRETQIAFYGGSFTAMDREEQVGYLKAIHPFLTSGLINSIRISTRPDALDEATLFLLKENGVKTVEIGVQSMVNQVLLLSNRGHSAEDTMTAIPRLRRWGFEIGVHLMIGLPGDTHDYFLQSLDQIIELKPDFVRIHPTLVLKGAPLENLWETGRYAPLSLEEAIDWLKKGILKLEKTSISVARIGLQPTKELEEHLIVGPYHPALHQLVDSAIFYDMSEYLLQNFSNGPQAIFLCNPKEVSNLRGQRNGNILKLKKLFKLKEIMVNESKELPRGCLAIQTQEGEISIYRRSLGF